MTVQDRPKGASGPETYPVPSDFASRAHVDGESYARMYAASVSDPEGFWREEGRRIDWITPYTRVKNTSFEPGKIDIRWFEDGTLNVSANCVDRHLATRGDQTAIIWEPDDPETPAKHITYRELHREVCKMANVLEDLGIVKGDRVVLYLPMIPEAAYAMLACARIGAIHSIVFAGFSSDALAARINGCDAKLVITADYAPRGGRKTPLKSNCDAALLHVIHDCKPSWSSAAPASRPPGSRAATTITTSSASRPMTTRRPSRWGPKTRSSSSTPQARPASPRGSSIPLAAISSMRLSHIN